MGVVYAAVDEKLNRLVAVKTIRDVGSVSHESGSGARPAPPPP